MLICDSARYPGTPLGPNAGSMRWHRTPGELQDRITSIHALHLPAELSKGQHTSSALPVLGYMAQVVPPSPLVRE